MADCAAFERWLEGRVGRFELDDGQVVAMAPKPVAHARVKVATFDGLRVGTRGMACKAFTDGMAVRIGDHIQREPDAAPRCGDPLDLDATFYTDPIVLVEVTSPSTATIDAIRKLIDYARIETLKHCLIVDTAQGLVVHHRRVENGFFTAILPVGTVHLDPPAFDLNLDAVLAPIG